MVHDVPMSQAESDTPPIILTGRHDVWGYHKKKKKRVRIKRWVEPFDYVVFPDTSLCGQPYKNVTHCSFTKGQSDFRLRTPSRPNMTFLITPRTLFNHKLRCRILFPFDIVTLRSHAYGTWNLGGVQRARETGTYPVLTCTRWFKYDRDKLRLV
jgi:hypothetical protein